MNAPQKEALESLAKVFAVLGAFLSAMAGTYLGVDSVEAQTTAFFRTLWLWLPVLLICPVGWFIAFVLDAQTATTQNFILLMIIMEITTIVIVLVRFRFFWNDRVLLAAQNERSRKAAWIILVFGFDLLFFGSLLDAIGYFINRGG